MKKASITEAKNKLSALIDGLKSAPVLIVDRGRPVARLEAVSTEAEGRLQRLTRDGVVRPGRSSVPRTFLAEEPPRPKRGASAVAALIAERREER